MDEITSSLDDESKNIISEKSIIIKQDIKAKYPLEFDFLNKTKF